MSRSSIAMGDSWVLCKSAVLTAKIQRHECDRQLWVGHSRKMCNQSPILQGTFIRKSGFTESSYVNIISGKFTGNERGATSSS